MKSVIIFLLILKEVFILPSMQL